MRWLIREPGHPLWQAALYTFCIRIMQIMMTVTFRYRRFHTERATGRQGRLLVANHQSYLDPEMISCAIPDRQIHFIARGGLFESKLFGGLISALNSIPIRENGGDTAAIKEAIRLLREDRIVLIFPEGVRTHDGVMQPFKRGAALLLRRAKCPVQPVAVDGAFDAWPRDKAIPKLWGQRVAVLFGEPISPDDLMRDGPDAALERLQREVQSLHAQLRRKLYPAGNED